MLGICSANLHRPAIGIFCRLACGPMPDLIGIWSACCNRPAIKPTGILHSGRLLFAAFGPRILSLNAVIGPTSGRSKSFPIYLRSFSHFSAIFHFFQQNRTKKAISHLSKPFSTNLRHFSKNLSRFTHFNAISQTIQPFDPYLSYFPHS